MRDELNLIQTIEEVAKKDPRYPEDAYFFILRGLNFTAAKLEKPRHVTVKMAKHVATTIRSSFHGHT